jgi:glycolate oxidase FAD binding subunit
MEDAWAASTRALDLPLAPAALELFSDGRVLARFFGSPDAVKRMVAELGWKTADASVWAEHARRGPESWARIATPPHALRQILSALPANAEWWASPGAGIAHWSFGDGSDDVRSARAAAEAAQGSLVLMAAPPEVAGGLGAWGTPPPTIEVMRRIKRAFDPAGILNPGRFVV